MLREHVESFSSILWHEPTTATTRVFRISVRRYRIARRERSGQDLRHIADLNFDRPIGVCRSVRICFHL